MSSNGYLFTKSITVFVMKAICSSSISVCIGKDIT
ncbi:MAG: hypothetical protein ACI81G_001992, partial [Gammaproteobacteria bacterium]